ncbi:hypothetical protein [Kitasatospora cineracea]|uniref:CHAP domain-containing protein n=1 Tax=Kitasatospora cineracea TaxID=88074 RepID=A0A3N4R9I9_9ACTN|nr:hypothetical protein [Kitasatospora cineracea]RPE27271.1 hypothetical protein EDD38_7416 [Kitasatospora cineracea]
MRDEFTALLRSQVGQHEGRDSDGTWNNQQRYSRETPGLEWSDGQPWCATLQCWAAHRTPGMEPLWPMTASCLTAVAWWKRAGRWSNYPVLGGPFYLGPDGGTHTGTVVGYDATTITTVEGNSNNNGSAEGDGVYLKTRSRSSIYGYGVPAYPEGTISADPRLGGRASAAVSTPTPVQEDDMPLTDNDIQRVSNAVWGYRLPDPDVPGRAVAAGDIQAYSDHRHTVLYNRVVASQGAIAALTDLVAKGTNDLTAAQVQQAVDASIERFMAGASVQVTVNSTTPKGN